MGATGGMLMAKLIGELERRGQRYGLQTMCEIGGTAHATIIEVFSNKSKWWVDRELFRCNITVDGFLCLSKQLSHKTIAQTIARMRQRRNSMSG